MQKIALNSLNAVIEALRDGVNVFCDVTSPWQSAGVLTQEIGWCHTLNGVMAPVFIGRLNPSYCSIVLPDDFESPKYKFYAVI